MMTKQYISRKSSFDSGHRVLDQAYKCKSLHGHTYIMTLEFEFSSSNELGYSIDFSEIKRVGEQWVQDFLDHGMILNPQDYTVISATRETNSKLWVMSLNGWGNYCNPSVENIAKEIFLAMEIIFSGYSGLKIHKVQIYETPNCYTDCISDSITETERNNFRENRYEAIKQFSLEKGILEYDERKQVKEEELPF